MKDDRRISSGSSGLSDVPSDLSAQSPSNKVCGSILHVRIVLVNILTRDLECTHTAQQISDTSKAGKNRRRRRIQSRLQAAPQNGYSRYRTEGSQEYKENNNDQVEVSEEAGLVNKFGGVAFWYI
jgi:hypothetical protein